MKFYHAAGARVGGPLRQKKTEGGQSEGLSWAVCEMQGWRAAMEDSEDLKRRLKECRLVCRLVSQDASCIVASLPEPLANQERGLLM